MFFSIKELKKNLGGCYPDLKPIVIFAEGTKTNGQGLIEIENDILKIITDACNDFIVHSIRFDYVY